MTVAIFEPYATGHRASYVRWIVQGLRLRGLGALIGGSPELLDQPQIASLLEDPGVHAVRLRAPSAMFSKCPPAIAGVARQISLRRYFGELMDAAARISSISGVVLPYADYCLYGIAALGSPFAAIPWCGISMRTPWSVLVGGASIRRTLLQNLCGSGALLKLYSIIPGYPTLTSAQRNALSGKVEFLPDPVELVPPGRREQFRQELGIASDAHVILAFGSLDARKGIDCLLAAMVQGGPELRIVALLVGQQSDQTRAMLREHRWNGLRSAGRLHVVDRFVDYAELGDAFAAADSAWLGYVGHAYMSGVFVLAAGNGLPIVATSEGAIGYLADSLSLTLRVNPRDIAQVIGALNKLGKSVGVRRNPDECSAILSEHSTETFGARIAQLFVMPGSAT